MQTQSALIVGAGAGLSAAFARLLAREGFAVALAARSTEDLAALAQETGATRHACDATDGGQVERLFAGLPATPDLVLYNASFRTRGPLVELDPAEVHRTLEVCAWGGFLVAQAAARLMLARPGGASGSLFFTGASASVKGYAGSAPFAMGKFALRGLAQSLARELAPRNIHVAHFVIDGGIASASRSAPAEQPDGLLLPDAIAASYLAVHRQHRSAWTWEMELRPWLERF